LLEKKIKRKNRLTGYSAVFSIDMRKIMKPTIYFILFAMVAISSCHENTPEKFEQEIINADKTFSDYSVKHGQIKAFLEFAAPDVVLLKPNMFPIVGHKELAKHYINKTDSSFVLTWEPKFARVSKSGDLGYTYGYWEFHMKSNPQKIERGTYVTIWQRQENGQWKFVLDTGNDGLGE